MHLRVLKLLPAAAAAALIFRRAPEVRGDHLTYKHARHAVCDCPVAWPADGLQHVCPRIGALQLVHVDLCAAAHKCCDAALCQLLALSRA